MARTFRCKHCGLYTRQNPRLKGNQCYCSKKECQKVRKRCWANHKYAVDSEYREKNKLSQKKWRQTHHADQYQKQYRISHPDYDDRNRQLQLSRNKKELTTLVSTISESSSLILQHKGNKVYSISIIENGFSAKRCS